MFDLLFKQPSALARQRNAPLAPERASFLTQRAEEGAARGTLVRLARELLVVVKELDLANNDMITPLAIEAAANRWARHQTRRHRAHTAHWSRIFFRQTATAWLQFLGRLSISEPEPKPFASLVERFADNLQHERELSSATIANYQWHIERFLTWFSTQQRIFAEVSVTDTDTFLARQGAYWCRVSIATSAKALRAFFRYAEVQQWCSAGIAAANVKRMFTMASVQGRQLICDGPWATATSSSSSRVPALYISYISPTPSIPKSQSSAALSAPMLAAPNTRTPRSSAHRISLCQTEGAPWKNPSTIPIRSAPSRARSTRWAQPATAATSGSSASRAAPPPPDYLAGSGFVLVMRSASSCTRATRSMGLVR